MPTPARCVGICHETCTCKAPGVHCAADDPYDCRPESD